MPKKEIQLSLLREVSEDGHFRDHQEALQPEEIPPILLSTAIGKFPFLEKHLRRRKDVSLPPSWQVQHLFTAVAVASAELFLGKEMNDQEGQIQVALIADDNSDLQHGEYVSFGFKVQRGEDMIEGRIFSPSSQFYNGHECFGLPDYIGYKNHTGTTIDYLIDFGNDALLPKGEEFFDLLAERIPQA